MIFKLSLSSLKFEYLVNICLIASMVSVIAPLMLLFSLRFGIVSNLEEKLVTDPRNLEIRMMSGYQLDKSFFEELKNDPHIDFYIPLTRSLSVTANVNFKGKMITNLEAIPTKAGDPLVIKSGIKVELQDDEAYLSEQIAQDLNIKVGDKFKFVISRIKEGRTQNAIVQLTLKGIIKKEYLKYKSILIPLTPLIYMEDFRDGYEPPIFSDGSALNEQRKFFAKARIYVKTLDDVEVVDKKLRAHYQITSALESINNLKAICNVLDFILTVISLVSIFGGVIAICGLIWTNLSRLEKTFALLKLTGLNKRQIMLMVIFENLILSTTAYAIALGLFATAKALFNHYFSNILGQNTLVSLLTINHML
ncbi:MAG: FtsX-like permease family protein, partial [Succinivibrio sp.]|nr:FtsX-like permease family protein [Succinivibrio sp.]